MTKAKINTIRYGNCDRPKEILGCHEVKEGILICGWNPLASKLYVYEKEQNIKYEMKEIEEGFFIALLEKKKDEKGMVLVPDYCFFAKLKKEEMPKDGWKQYEDPYRWDLDISLKERLSFERGENFHLYKVLGAHFYERDGIKGTRFAVYAPLAKRVSVLGDWNDFDPRIHLMERCDEGGIFELFVPEAQPHMAYEFEIKTALGEEILRADPYRVCQHKKKPMLSVIQENKAYAWTDEKYQKNKNVPDIIYQVQPSLYRKKGKRVTRPYTYKQLTKELVHHMKKMGYTAVQLGGVMEHDSSFSLGEDVVAYFAPSSLYGTKEDFKYLINTLHHHNMKVYMEWNIATFSPAQNGLAYFDGTAVYEYENPLLGINAEGTGHRFHYQKEEVRSFLFSNACYWMEEYHMDGLFIDSIASVLYQDYGRMGGEWVRNQYGEKENLEAISFFRELTEQMKRRFPHIKLMIQDNSGWVGTTETREVGGLGFDGKWSNTWLKNYMGYLEKYPNYRAYDFWKMQYEMMAQRKEACILTISERENVLWNSTLIQKMPGEYFNRFANLRALYGYFFGICGEKLLFMGEDFAHWHPCDMEKGLTLELEEDPIHGCFQTYMKDLIQFYKNQEVLWKREKDGESFAWFHTKESEYGIFSFLRKTDNGKGNLLFVFHLRMEQSKGYLLTVPTRANYEIVFHSDKKEYGGVGNSEEGIIKLEKTMVDAEQTPYLIVDLPPLSMVVFSYDVTE